MDQQQASELTGTVAFDYGTGPALFPNMRNFLLTSAASNTTVAANQPLSFTCSELPDSSIFTDHFQPILAQSQSMVANPKPFSRILNFSIDFFGASQPPADLAIYVHLTDPLDATLTQTIKTLPLNWSPSGVLSASDYILMPVSTQPTSVSFSLSNSLYFYNFGMSFLLFSS